MPVCASATYSARPPALLVLRCMRVAVLYWAVVDVTRHCTSARITSPAAAAAAAIDARPSGRSLGPFCLGEPAQPARYAVNDVPYSVPAADPLTSRAEPVQKSPAVR